MYGCATSPPSSSRSKPVTSSKPEGEDNVPNLSQRGARGQVWQHHNRHATTSQQANSNIHGNLQQEWLLTPSLPDRGRASNPRPQESNPFTQKTRSSSPRKFIGKRSASVAEMGERLTSSKRIRQEGPEDAHSIPVISLAPGPSSHIASDANGAAITGDVAVTVQPPSDGHISASTGCAFEESGIEWEFWITEGPDTPATSNSDGRYTEDHASNCDAGGMKAFLDTWWKGIQKAKKSPTASSDIKSTIECDPLKEDREHAVPAATWYPWGTIYNEGTRSSQGFKDEEDEGREGPLPAGTVEVGEVPHGGDVIAREEDAGIEFLAPDLATPDGTNNSAMTGQSLSTPMLALSLAPPEVRLNTSHLLLPSFTASFTGSEAHTSPVGPSLTGSHVSSPPTTGEPFTAGATLNGAFRYSTATEAKIGDLALNDKYSAAYRLFDPSECAAILEGEDLTRFVRENSNKITKAAPNKTKLWVCQATAKWSEDGTVSYMAEPCRVANTTASIFSKHIRTQHLGKVLEKYEKKGTVDAEAPGE